MNFLEAITAPSSRYHIFLVAFSVQTTGFGDLSALTNRRLYQRVCASDIWASQVTFSPPKCPVRNNWIGRSRSALISLRETRINPGELLNIAYHGVSLSAIYTSGHVKLLTLEMLKCEWCHDEQLIIFV